MAPYDTLNAVTATAALLTVPFIWRRLGRGYAAMVVLGLLLPLSSGQFEGLGRYCSVLFPLSILLRIVEGRNPPPRIDDGLRPVLHARAWCLFGNVHPLF